MAAVDHRRGTGKFRSPAGWKPALRCKR